MAARPHPCPPGRYTWWVARVEEGPFLDTDLPAKSGAFRNGAIDEALGQEVFQEIGPAAPGDPYRAGFFLARARANHVDLSRYFDAGDWIDRVSDQMDDEDGPDEFGDNHPLGDLETAEILALEESVRLAIWHWQNRRVLRFKTYWLDMPDGVEWIVRDLPEGSA